MNLFSKIGGFLRSTATKIGGALQSAAGGLGANALSAYNTLASGGAGNFPKTNQTQLPLGARIALDNQPKVNQTYVPNANVDNKPAYIDPSGKAIVYGQGGVIDQDATLRANSGSWDSKGNIVPNEFVPNSSNISGGLRPTTYTPRNPTSGDTSASGGRTSTKQQGTPFMDSSGNWVVPTQGFAGMSGQGGIGYTAKSTVAAIGLPGGQGLGGGSSFNGVTSAAGTSAGGSSALAEEERQRRAEKTGTQVLTPTTPQTQAAVTAVTSPSQVKVQPPSVPETFDVDAIQNFIGGTSEAMNKIKEAGASLSDNDRQTILNQIGQNLLAAKAQLDQQLPAEMADSMVEDTMEQLGFINNSEDPFGTKAAMDAFRAENTTLGQLQGTRVELMKNIQALNSAYRPILDDIRTNPDLPKGLARRRIEDLAKTQKETLQGFLDQLDIVKQQISDQNEIVNRQFQIVNLSTNRENQARDDIRAQLKLFLDTGAIAGFDEVELKTFAQAANMPYAALKKAKEAALTPKQDIVTNEFADGSIKGIDKKTGKVVWSLPGAAKAGGAGSNVDYFVETVNGQRVQYARDKNTGAIISQTPLGTAGEQSGTDRKSLFLQYIASESGNKSVDEFKEEADKAGVVIDADVEAAMKRHKKDLWGFWR